MLMLLSYFSIPFFIRQIIIFLYIFIFWQFIKNLSFALDSNSLKWLLISSMLVGIHFFFVQHDYSRLCLVFLGSIFFKSTRIHNLMCGLWKNELDTLSNRRKYHLENQHMWKYVVRNPLFRIVSIIDIKFPQQKENFNRNFFHSDECVGKVCFIVYHKFKHSNFSKMTFLFMKNWEENSAQ